MHPVHHCSRRLLQTNHSRTLTNPLIFSQCLVRTEKPRSTRVQILSYSSKPAIQQLPQKRQQQQTTPAHPHQITHDDVNAPLTTLPAPLNLPKQSPDQGKISFYYQTGKTYLTFFKTGLKNTWANFQSARPLESQIEKTGNGSITETLNRDPRSLTRSQFQLVIRTRHDLRRLPVFALIFIVFGEFSPLILPFVSGAVPYNCRIPKQLERERRILEEKRERSLSSAGISSIDEAPGVFEKWREVKDLDSTQLKHVAQVLGIRPSPGFWARYYVRRRMEYLDIDDKLLLRGGGVAALDSGEELTMACIDRGINVRGRSERELRESLKTWFEARKKVGGDVKAGMWFFRPEQWKALPDLSNRNNNTQSTSANSMKSTASS